MKKTLYNDNDNENSSFDNNNYNNSNNLFILHLSTNCAEFFTILLSLQSSENISYIKTKLLSLKFC